MAAARRLPTARRRAHSSSLAAALRMRHPLRRVRQPDLRLAVRPGHVARHRLLESAPAASCRAGRPNFEPVGNSRVPTSSTTCRATRSSPRRRRWHTTMIAVGDNAACAASCEPKALVALLALGADVRDGRRSPRALTPSRRAGAAGAAAAAARRRRDPLSRRRSSRPRAIAAPLRSAVDLVRWQDFADMTEDLFDRLARDAVPQAREAAATQGYFSADVDDRPSTAATQPVSRHARRSRPARRRAIADVAHRRHRSAAATSPEGARRDREAARRRGCCRGATSSASRRGRAPRTCAVATLAASPYAAAQADRERSAHRSRGAQRRPLGRRSTAVRRSRIGDIDVRGLKRYTPELVRNFSNVSRRRPLRRAAARRLRAPAAGVRLLRERAGGDRPRPASRPTTRRSTLVGDRGADDAASSSASATRPTPSIARAPATATSTSTADGLQMLRRARASRRRSSRRTSRFVRPPHAGGWIDTYAAGVAAHRHREPRHAHGGRHGAPARASTSAARRRSASASTTTSRRRRAPDRRPRTRCTSTASTRGATSTTCSRPTRGWMANVQVGDGVPGASTSSSAA